MAYANVRLDMLYAASLFCASEKEDDRAYLWPVHVEPNDKGGVTLMGTNCHRLAVFHDPTGYVDARCLVRVNWRGPAYRVPKKGGTDLDYVRVTEDGSERFSLFVSSTQAQRLDPDVAARGPMRARIVEEASPSLAWRSLFRKNKTAKVEHAGINTQDMGLMGDALACFGSEGQVRLNMSEGGQGMIVRAYDFPLGAFITMPVNEKKGAEKVEGLPDWLA